MTRIQYQKGVSLPEGAVYCARTRDGLTEYANPFKNDSKGRIWQFTENKWEEVEHEPRKVESIGNNLFGDSIPVNTEKPFVGSIDLFRKLLWDPQAKLEWVVPLDVRKHMATLHVISVTELHDNTQLACWCSLDHPCHVDAIIEYRKWVESQPLAF